MMSMMINHNFPVLPADITIEILSRSSVDSVLQCKRVCKSWRTIINSPYFGHTHTDRLLLRNDQQNNSAATFDLFISTRILGRFDQFHIGKYNNVGMGALMVEKLIKHDDYPLRCPDNNVPSWFPIASSNGLLCFIHRPKGVYDVCIYNPLTTEYVNLPRSLILTNMSSNGNINTRFGYHSGTKEYKVVTVYYQDFYSCGQVSVYTLGNIGCKWRKKIDIPHRLQGTHNVLAYGALYWLSYLVKVNTKYIVSFDLADEEFRIVPSPPCLGDFELGVLEGCLSAGRWNPSRSTLDVWVMNNNHKAAAKADQEDCPWTNKYNIRWNEMSGPSYAPLALLKDGQLLLRYKDSTIVSYNLKTATFGGFHQIKNLFRIFPYMKSFISLKALGEDSARIGRRILA